jgi:hypothetical protein
MPEAYAYRARDNCASEALKQEAPEPILGD